MNELRRAASSSSLRLPVDQSEGFNDRALPPRLFLDFYEEDSDLENEDRVENAEEEEEENKKRVESLRLDLIGEQGVSSSLPVSPHRSSLLNPSPFPDLSGPVPRLPLDPKASGLLSVSSAALPLASTSVPVGMKSGFHRRTVSLNTSQIHAVVTGASPSSNMAL